MRVPHTVNNPFLSDIPGIQVGHAQDLDAATGCTVLLTPDGAVCGVDQRGGAPGTRETDLLHPMHLVSHVHAVLLAGGSAFGLAAGFGTVYELLSRFSPNTHAVELLFPCYYGVSIGSPIISALVLFLSCAAALALMFMVYHRKVIRQE